VRAATGAPTRSSGALLAGGLVAAGVAVFGLVLIAASSYEFSAVLLLAPILVLISVPVLLREARRAEDRALFWLLLLAILVKLGGAVASYYVAYDVYGGVADAAGYHRTGADIAERFRAGIFDPGLESYTGTEFIRLVTGIVYTIIGTTGLGGFLVFSWLSFWGLFFFYRAFVTAVPEGRFTSYAKLVFFLPSLVFWPSTIGKEAWMVFALGIGALGAALVIRGRTWRGLLLAAGGLWLATLVRPHMAGLMAVSLIGGYLFRRSRRELGSVAPVAKAVALAALVGLAALLVIRTERFLREAQFETRRGVAAFLEQTSERTSLGGSRFAPSVLDSPARAPVAIVSVLYRPTLLEAHNAQTFLAALETTFLLGLTAFRWRWILSAARSIRRQPYVAFAGFYTALFIVAFSAFANFGLLARERVQMLPLFLVLLCVPPLHRQEEDVGGR
jgi:hypothetical protein